MPEPKPINYKDAMSCPDSSLHFKGLPADLDLNTGKSPTLKQVQCPTCGFWVRWVPKYV